MSIKTKYLVVLGVADDRKARAARFALADEAAVRKMAGLMNFRVGIPKTEQGVMLASKLPEGKLFESGLGMIPLVREEVFYKLFELLTFDQTWNALGVISGRGHAAGPDLVKAADSVWSAIKVGSTVLAFQGTDPTEFAWSAAIEHGHRQQVSVGAVFLTNGRLDQGSGRHWTVARLKRSLVGPISDNLGFHLRDALVNADKFELV